MIPEQSPEDIYITGIAGAFPDSRSVHELQENLFNKVDLISDDERRWKQVESDIPQRTGKLFDIHKFDASFFDINYKRAHFMDPAARILHEKTYEAIIDAGFNPSEFRGQKVGVFFGYSFMESVFTSGYLNQPLHDYGALSSSLAILPNLISEWLGVTGPSETVDTACSSSSYAIELAVKALQEGRCDAAIAGGANLCLLKEVSQKFANLGVLSEDGRCKCFDNKADGYCRSETVAVVLLQKAKVSRRAYAKIVHAKTNCDGSKEHGITFPAGDIQKQLLLRFYKECSIAPSLVEYIEAHGTGTRVGDPEELNAVDEVFCSGRADPLLIGSIKSNLGHSEPAAGICALSKLVIAYHTGYIPPNINFWKPREGVAGLEVGRLKVVTEKQPWSRGLSAFSSFGFGGANAHVLLDNVPRVKVNKGLPSDDLPRLVCVSGRTKSAVARILDHLQSTTVDVNEVRLWHSIHDHEILKHPYRGFILLNSKPTHSIQLERDIKHYRCNRKTVYFVYPGINKLWPAMASNLMKLPVFANIIKRCHEVLRNNRIDLMKMLTDPNHDDFNNVRNCVVSTVAVQLGFTEVLRAVAVEPNHVFGYGVGELSKAYADNTLTLEQVVLAAYHVGEALNEDGGLSDSAESQLLKSLKAIKGSGKFDEFINNLQNPIKLFKKPEKIEANAIVVEVTPCQTQEFENFSKVSFFGQSSSFGLQTLLTTLGKLFQKGLNPHLANIYPPVQFPVAQGTSMLSHLIEWNHSDNWFVQIIHKMKGEQILENVVEVSLTHDDKSFLAGHVIDGRNLYPATGYLEMVWKIFVKTKTDTNAEISVVFENVTFSRATTIPKTGSLEFQVSIHRGTGNFEVVEGDTVVVTGRIYEKKNVASEYRVIPEEANNADEDKRPNVNLTAKDFYKELHLRGYQYKNIFRGVIGCNINGTRGSIIWKQNWTSFLDAMLQPMIVTQDTRSLYVPTRIEKLSIDVDVHNQMLKEMTNHSKIFVFQSYPQLQVTRISGVELRGLHVMAISRKPPLGIPVYEKHQFVSFYGKESMLFNDILRSNFQLVHENIHTYKFKCLELIDEEYKNNKLTPAITAIDDILADLPLVQADLLVITKDSLELPSNITVSNNNYSSESNVLVFVGANMLQRDDLLLEATKTLKEGGFIISRESKFSNPYEYSNNDYEIVTIQVTESEFIVLLRKKTVIRTSKFIRILTADEKFSWIDEVKKEMKASENLVLFSQNESINGLLGLVNCLRREPGGENIQGLLIEDLQAPEFNPQLEIYNKQLMRNLPMNVYKNGEWGTYCHLLLEEPKTFSSTHAYSNTIVTGDLSSLRWIQGPLKMNQTFKSPNINLIHVYASGINFRDVVTALGRVTKDAVARTRIAQECVQGMEVSGRMANGTRVMAVCNKGIANLACAESSLTWPIPEEWTFQEAATIPIAYATVYASLVLIGKMRRGESILIHVGSGAVGQAAINVSLHHGLKVFTTVGTTTKRGFLKKLFPQLKDSHIGNSRDTSFEDMILYETGGKGVDLVLNSLADDKLQASVRCLAQRGRFLEIGKYDITLNTHIETHIFRREISFHGVMLDYVFEGASQKIRENLQWLLMTGIISGAVRPVTSCTFDKEELESAFRYMAAGKHIGKIVIYIRDEEIRSDIPVKPVSAPIDALLRYWCDEDEVFVLVGGLGGFGLELADWLVLRGAKKLLLCSRRGISNGYQALRIRIWMSYEVDVQISLTDVTTEAGCEEMLQLANSMGPVRAVFNLAVILKDAVFENQTQETFRQSYGPKAIATIHLDKLTRRLCPRLKDFVVFSSVSCGRGNAGQTNYGFSNSVMERICEIRHKEGLPALAIQWGAIGDVGLVADMQEENIQIEIGGTLQQRIVSCFEAMDVFLTQKSTPIVSSIVVAEKKRGGSKNGTTVDAVAAIMGIKDLKTVSLQVPLAELGMDSIMAVEIKQTLERDYEIFLSAQEIRNLTFGKLVEYASEQTEKNVVLSSSTEEKTNKTDFLKHLLQNFGDEQLTSQSSVWLPTLGTDAETPNEKTIFMMSGIESCASTLKPLCSKLKCKACVLQLGMEHLEEDFDQMADRLYPIIKSQISPGGTFVLLSYSFGTLVQQKLAAKLESEGYKGTIVCVDGGPDFLKILAKSAVTDGDFENVDKIQRAVLEKFLNISCPTDMRSIVTNEVYKFESFDERIRTLVNMAPENLQYSKMYMTNIISAAYYRLSLVIRTDLDKLDRKLKSKIVLIRAKTLPSFVECSEDYGLGIYGEGDVTIHRLNEDHQSIIESEECANIINEIVTQDL